MNFVCKVLTKNPYEFRGRTVFTNPLERYDTEITYICKILARPMY